MLWINHILLLCVPGFVLAGTEPLWELSKNAISPSLCSGKVDKVDGKVSLRNGAAFAIPAEAFPDQKSFTVQVTLSVNELPGKALFTFMNKQTAKDDGFDFSVLNLRTAPGNYYIHSSVNKILMESWVPCGRMWPEINVPSTFTLAVRNGYATFYFSERPIKTCLMEMMPNSEPMWIGRNTDPQAKFLPVTIHDVKVYGPDYKFVSKSEENSKRRIVGGQGWAINAPKMEHPEWPKVVIYGDSISGGYGPILERELSKRNIYLFYFGGFVGGDVPEQAITDAAASFKFDVIVFNNGLHALHWTKDAVSDEVVIDRMHKMARSFKKGATQAKIFYLSTTPYTTGSRDATPSPVTKLGDRNNVVIRLNTLSAQVMKEENIGWIDVYSILASKLELANGDNFHWQKPAYEIISQEVAKRVLPLLKKDK